MLPSHSHSYRSFDTRQVQLEMMWRRGVDIRLNGKLQVACVCPGYTRLIFLPLILPYITILWKG